MLAEQQKQTLEYANRLDENDKKCEEMTRKISTLLQELNKCKIELHYYRSKSPATPICNNCGQTTSIVPPVDLLALMKHCTGNRESLINNTNSNLEMGSDPQSYESSMPDLADTQLLAINAMQMMSDFSCIAPIKTNIVNEKNLSPNIFSSPKEGQQMQSNLTTTEHRTKLIPTIDADEKRRSLIVSNVMVNAKYIQVPTKTMQQSVEHTVQKKMSNSSSVILTVGTPRFYGKRKLDEYPSKISTNDTSLNLSESVNGFQVGNGQTSTNNEPVEDQSISKQNVIAANVLVNSKLSDSYSKKARRVQNKMKIQSNSLSIKTRIK